MYTGFITFLKILQCIGYAVSAMSGIAAASILSQFGGGGVGFISFLFSTMAGCFVIYLTTQGLISIIDLLNIIEANTSNSHRGV
jgi:hypothetical protein